MRKKFDRERYLDEQYMIFTNNRNISLKESNDMRKGKIKTNPEISVIDQAEENPAENPAEVYDDVGMTITEHKAIPIKKRKSGGKKRRKRLPNPAKELLKLFKILKLSSRGIKETKDGKNQIKKNRSTHSKKIRRRRK